MDFSHTPVLLQEVLALFPANARSMVDLTLGGAGHAFALMDNHRELFLYGVDQDKEAIDFAEKKLQAFANRFELIHQCYSKAIDILINKSVKTDFILVDLGVSSHQLDRQHRGFSFRQNGPLDMRMDNRRNKTAADVVNRYSKPELVRIIRQYGEESFAKRIAENIVKKRARKPIETTWELADCVREAVPKKFQFGKLHPATKTFQAIRIEVNNELEELGYLLENGLELLSPKGVFAIISFHSLEDRLVKKTFKMWENPCECPKNIPYCICNAKPKGQIITHKIKTADASEKSANPRSRSAKLRAFRKA